MSLSSIIRFALLAKTGAGGAAVCYALGSLVFSLLSDALEGHDDSAAQKSDKTLSSQASSVVSAVASNLSAARIDHFKADLRAQNNADVDRLVAAAFREALSECRRELSSGELMADPYQEWFSLWDAHLAKAESETLLGPGAASFAVLLFQQPEGIAEVFGVDLSDGSETFDPARWWGATEGALLRWARLEYEESGKSGPLPGDALPDSFRTFLQQNLSSLVERSCKLLMKSDQHRRAWIVFQQQAFSSLQRVSQDTREEVRTAFEKLGAQIEGLDRLLLNLGMEVSRMDAKVGRLVEALPRRGDYPFLKQLLDGSRMKWGQPAAVDGFSLGLCSVAAGILQRWEEWRSDRYLFETHLKNAVNEYMADGPVFVAAATTLDEDSATLLRSQLQAARELCASVAPPVVHRESVIVSWIRGDTNLIAEDIRPTIAANPLDELTVQVANRFHNQAPRRFATELIRLISEYAASSPEAAASALWSEFNQVADASLSENRYWDLRVWCAEDSPPDDVFPGATIAGQQPSLEDFRSGSLCRRTLFDQIESLTLDWLQSLSDHASFQRFPAGWILGRSGCGKSCGLFFLLWSLHRRGFGPIVYLVPTASPNATPVEDAIMWAAELAGSGQRAIVVLDQPMALLLEAHATESLFRGLVTRLSDRHQGQETHFRMPALLLAGSSEQAGLLRANAGNTLVIREIEFPAESSDDLHELRDWLGKRRPELLHNLRQTDLDSDTLAVQAIFEWTQGQTLREFALRLRDQRLSLAPGAAECVASILALNRLQLAFPAEAMDRILGAGDDARAGRPTVATLIRGLIQDRHLVLRGSGIRGYWLGHPHLTDLIFRCWVSEPRAGINETTALTGGVLAYLQASNCTPVVRAEVLWGIVRELNSGNSILSPDSTLEAVNRALQDLGWRGRVPGWLLPACLELQNRFPSFLAGASLASEALREIETAPAEATHLTPLCLAALETSRDLAETEAVWQVAIERLRSGKAWGDWGAVCHRLLDERGEGAVATVLDVCRVRRGQPAIPLLLQRCLETGSCVEPVSAAAGPQLYGAPATPAWGNLCITLLRHSPATAPIPAVMGWIDANRDEFGICFVLAELLRRGVAAAEIAADQWLMKWSRHRAASYVLEPRLDCSPGNPVLLRYARQWLRRDVGDNSRLLERVIRQGGKTSLENYRLGLWWLQTHSPTHQSWFSVWRCLKTCFGPSVPQASVGHNVLRGLAPGLSAWGKLWLELAAMPPPPELDRCELVAKGKLWLKENPGNLSWYAVWAALMEGEASSDLESLGLEWLRRGLGEAPGWTKAWEVLAIRPSSSLEARSIGWDWLVGAPAETETWRNVWAWTFGRQLSEEGHSGQLIDWLERSPVATKATAALWKRVNASRASARLLDLALGWLRSPLDGTVWIQLWTDCWSQAPGDQRLVDAACSFLRTQPRTELWGQLLARLLQWENREEWVRMAFGWLASEGIHANGGSLWSAVWQSSSTRERRRSLREWAEQWLSASISSPQWIPIWVRLWDDEEPDETLAALGFRRLRECLEGAWQEVWKRLEPTLAGTAEEKSAALSVLRSTPLDTRGWDGIFEWLCSHQAEGQARQVLRERFLNTPKDAEEWPKAWQIALLRLGNPELHEAGRDWLATRLGSHVHWLVVWNTLVRFVDERPRLEQLGANWLSVSNTNNGNWPYVCRATLLTGHAQAALHRAARDWLKQRLDHALWPELWHELWKQDVNDALLRGLAAEWMAAYPDHPAWQESVWWPIWSSEPGDDRWRSAGLDWLKQVKPDHRSWHYVWKRLLTEGRADSALVERALAWLRRSSDGHHSWGTVWLDVWRRGAASEELGEMGLSWLRGEHQRSASWVDVWKALRSFDQSESRHDELDEIARSVLVQGEVDAQRWTLLWEALHQLGKPSAEMPIIGLRWLRSTNVDNYWMRSATLLARVLNDRNAIIDAGLRRLARSESGLAFAQTWLNLRKFEPHSAELRERGKHRLRSIMGEVIGWSEMWRALLASEAEEDMRRMIEEWLRETDAGHRGWYWVWSTYLLYLEEIHSTEPQQDLAPLISMGRAWIMADAPFSHVYWEKMWSDVRSRSSGPDLAAMDNRGRFWLEEAPPSHIAWQYLWKVLWTAQPGSDVLTRSAKKWLARAPLAHQSWQYVFSRLWEQRPGEPDLVELAMRFLNTSRSHQSWVRCFEELWRWDPNSTVYYEVGVKWLRQNLLAEHREWSWLWEKLWKQRSDDPELQQLLMSWLVQSDHEHGAWTLLWQKAMGVPELQPIALKIGRQWLADRVRKWNAVQFAIDGPATRLA